MNTLNKNNSNTANFRRVSFCLRVLSLLAVLFVASSVFARVQQGPFVGFCYMPGGYALQTVPFDNEPKESGSVNTETESGKEFTSFGKYSVYGGYVYDRFYGQIGFSSATVSNQTPDYPEYRGDAIETKYNAFELRGGMRFSAPGDSSYNGFFLGIRRAGFSTDYLGLDVTGTGLVSGLSGFYSLGCKWDVEFVLSAEVYFANYLFTNIDADFDTHSPEKKYAAAFGSSLGVGFQYEPYNITCMLKGALDYDQIAQITKVGNADAERDLKMAAISYGFEVSYRYYNYKHNR